MLWYISLHSLRPVLLDLTSTVEPRELMRLAGLKNKREQSGFAVMNTLILQATEFNNQGLEKGRNRTYSTSKMTHSRPSESQCLTALSQG